MKLNTPFKGTYLENNVLDFYDTDINSVIRHNYTPFRLIIWNRGNRCAGIAEKMILHEYSHIIDHFIQGNEHKLLIPDFGYKSTYSFEWSLKMIKNETRVLAYQQKLRTHLNLVSNFRVDMDSIDFFFNYLYIERFMSMDDYFDMFEDYKTKVNSGTLIDAFVNAIQYIKDKRNETSSVI